MNVAEGVNGGVGYSNCLNTSPGRLSQATHPRLFLDALEENPSITSTVWRADPASEGIVPERWLVRRSLPEDPKGYSKTATTC